MSEVIIVKSRIFETTAASLLLCIFAGCGCSGNVGVAPPPEGSPDVAVKRSPRETSEMIKTQWDRFADAEEAREQRRSITRIGALGADAESEIEKLQAIADDEKYDEQVRETATLNIDRIRKAVEAAAE